MHLFMVELIDARRIWARSIHLSETYETMLIGEPFPALNEELLASSPIHHPGWRDDRPRHLIDPVRTRIEDPEPPRARPIEYLPPFRVEAQFESFPLADGYRSWLVVVWFQDEPFPIPSEAVLPKLREISWDSLARDFDP